MEHLKAPSQQQQIDSSPSLKAEAAKLAKVLLGCYRSGDANDPDIYVRAVTAVLGDYPLDVARTVCDPRKGLPAKSKWLPTVAEIKDACEAQMAPVYRRQHEERLAQERRSRLPAPDIQRMTREEMAEKYGPNWGLKGDGDAAGVESSARRTSQLAMANAVSLRREYQEAGIVPIEAAPGIPVSLDLARKLGRVDLKAERS